MDCKNITLDLIRPTTVPLSLGQVSTYRGVVWVWSCVNCRCACSACCSCCGGGAGYVFFSVIAECSVGDTGVCRGWLDDGRGGEGVWHWGSSSGATHHSYPWNSLCPIMHLKKALARALLTKALLLTLCMVPWWSIPFCQRVLISFTQPCIWLSTSLCLCN